MHDDLYNGLKAEVEEATRIFLERGWSAEKVLNDALVEGMRIVGIDFRDGILFVPEVLLAANSMKGGMEILRPLLAETGVEPIGKIVIGTVKGDIHDIGKNLVSMMLEGAGFEVIDLGINNPVEKYLDALEQAQARHPRHVRAADHHHALHEGRHRHAEGKGIRKDYIVLVGGAPLNEEFGKAVGATPTAAMPPSRSRLPKACSPRGALRPGRMNRLTPSMDAPAAGILIIACGALAREIAALRRVNGWSALDVHCLPAELHNRPERIAPAVRRADPRRIAPITTTIFVAYGDCGTRWHARCGAARRGRRAHCRRPLLRILRRRRAVRRHWPMLSPARSISPIFCCAISTGWSSAGWASIAIPSCWRVFRQLSQAGLSGTDAPAPAALQAQAIAARIGLAYFEFTSLATAAWARLCWPLLKQPQTVAMASLTLISWRDIPAQVVVKRGRETAKVQLSERFQEAVDRAAMRAGKGSSDAYLADGGAAIRPLAATI